MCKRKILFITEGEIDEPKFIDKCFKKCYPNVEYEYYSYSTDIHTLARLLFNDNNELDEYLDVQQVLKANESNYQKKKILSQKYSDIILVFDFDPQTTKPEFNKISKMLCFFNDSTNNGMLYINYPMMQSYRHIISYPEEEDNEFKDRVVSQTNCANYKRIVNKESCFSNINKYDFPKIMRIIGYQLKKASYILNNTYAIPSPESFETLDLNRIYKLQCQKNRNEHCIYVLNTFVFNLIEYNPKKVIENIKKYE